MPNARSHHGSSLPYDPLSKADVQRILDAVFQLMREIGVKFGPHPRVLDLLSDAGCDISAESIVRFPTELVKNSLGSVAKNAKIWNRHGTDYIELSTGHTNFVAGITCINVIDVDTGQRRPSTREDLARLIRVADALPDIDAITLPCKMTEKPSAAGEMEEFAVMATSTTKPLAYLCEYAEALELAIEVAVAVRGGPEQLREKPYFLHGVTALPLHYAPTHLDQILLGADNGIPLFLGTGTIGGATAPVTIAGNLVHSFATDFAGLVLTQLLEEGSFCMGGTAVGFIDPMTGHLGSVAETALAEAAKCQIARSLGLPVGAGIAGANRGHRFNQEAISITASNMMLTVHTRPTTCDYLGLIESGLTYSLHSLLLCHEFVGMVRRLWRGISVDDETLGLDLTRAVGPGGHYLAERHTARHCRTELWKSRYFQTSTPETWEQDGSKDLVDKIDRDLRRILETHEPEPMSEPIQREIDAILEKFRAI